MCIRDSREGALLGAGEVVRVLRDHVGRDHPVPADMDARQVAVRTGQLRQPGQEFGTAGELEGQPVLELHPADSEGEADVGRAQLRVVDKMVVHGAHIVPQGCFGARRECEHEAVGICLLYTSRCV